jgi:hypothetical protein
MVTLILHYSSYESVQRSVFTYVVCIYANLLVVLTVCITLDSDCMILNYALRCEYSRTMPDKDPTNLRA